MTNNSNGEFKMIMKFGEGIEQHGWLPRQRNYVDTTRLYLYTDVTHFPGAFSHQPLFGSQEIAQDNFLNVMEHQLGAKCQERIRTRVYWLKNKSPTH